MSFCSLCTVFAVFADAGYPPPVHDTTTVRVPGSDGITISYKETTICETKSRGFSGYVHLPASSLADVLPGEAYNISMFFWYFPARQQSNNAQTAIYLAGGPGQSSMYGAAQGGGPCTILPNSNSTQNNPYSWNEYVNMLYVDQPVGVGYSYSALVNSTMDLLTSGLITPMEQYNGRVPAENQTFLYGTFPDQGLERTAPNSAVAARVLWRFSQAWFSSFPEYETQDKRVSLWGNSYGGYFVPTSAEYFERQNSRIRNGELPGGHVLDVDTIGWTNGCADVLYQAEWYPDMAYNNTYGLELISKETFDEVKTAYLQPDGCRDMILECRHIGDTYDPEQTGLNSTVNTVCLNALIYCAMDVVQGPYASFDRSVYDIGHFKPDPFPARSLIGFFNREWVQRELGVPLNCTAMSSVIFNTFNFNGDAIRTSGMKNIEYLLDRGVKVAMMYGDRNFQCNWMGGEHLSLEANWTGAAAFRNAGYEFIQTSSCYTGGVVRQHGNMSFARVFDAGHDLASYQPQTAFEIFTRAMLNLDIATGKKTTMGAANRYSSQGPLSSLGWRNKLPIAPPVECNLYDVQGSCTDEQIEALEYGAAEVVDFRVV